MFQLAFYASLDDSYQLVAMMSDQGTPLETTSKTTQTNHDSSISGNTLSFIGDEMDPTSIPAINHDLSDSVLNTAPTGQYTTINLTYKPTKTELKELLHFVDKESHQENEEWESSLFFNATTDHVTFEKINILKHIGKKKGTTGSKSPHFRIYFHQGDYPVHEECENIKIAEQEIISQQLSNMKGHRIKARFKSSAYKKLSKDIRQVAFQFGFHLVLNGNQGEETKKNG